MILQISKSKKHRFYLLLHILKLKEKRAFLRTSANSQIEGKAAFLRSHLLLPLLGLPLFSHTPPTFAEHLFFLIPEIFS